MGKIDSDNEELPALIDVKQIGKDVNTKTGPNNTIWVPPPQLSKSAYISTLAEYKSLYDESIKTPGKFWSRMASDFYFHEKSNSPSFHFNFDLRKGPVYTKFMEGCTTNVCYNMLDRHILNGRGNKIAFYWEGNNPEDTCEITYAELHEKVCKFSNGLKSLGVGKGDVVAIYMPMVIEIVVAMLGCLRIGAVHSVVFAGYSAQALADRLIDGKVKVLITADGSYRGEKFTGLRKICDEAMLKSSLFGHAVSHCIVFQHLKRLRNFKRHPDSEYQAPSTPSSPLYIDWDTLCSASSSSCPPTWVDSEHPMFTLYTSGSTGKPKGIVHATGGYMVFASTVFKYSFDFHPDRDLFWCTSDMGWCCAHTNSVFGPLSLGGTAVIFEGTPFHPSITRPWSIIDKYGVTVFYTAPTVLRHIMKYGDSPVESFNLSTLRILGTVGEPINKGCWEWFHRVVGKSRCPIVDTYGQTETGGHLLTSVPGATPTKPGAVGLPFFGCVPVLLTKGGRVIEGAGEGCLAFSQPWPCILRTVHGDEGRFQENFAKFPGYYCTGDAARRDADGFFWITGRVDDMLNVSGHLLSTTSIETVFLEHDEIAEVAVVPVKHDIKGQCLHAFVIVKEFSTNQNIIQELKNKVREKVGSFAVPDVIILTPVLPMTRSGKILRRVLVNVALKNEDFGDTSTLVDPSVLNILKDLTKNNANKS